MTHVAYLDYVFLDKFFHRVSLSILFDQFYVSISSSAQTSINDLKVIEGNLRLRDCALYVLLVSDGEIS